MILSAYVQATEPNIIQLWVGLFDIVDPPLLSFLINGIKATPLESPMISPINDKVTDSNGKPLNHCGVFRFAVSKCDAVYRIEIEANRKTPQ